MVSECTMISEHHGKRVCINSEIPPAGTKHFMDGTRMVGDPDEQRPLMFGGCAVIFSCMFLTCSYSFRLLA